MIIMAVHENPSDRTYTYTFTVSMDDEDIAHHQEALMEVNQKPELVSDFLNNLLILAKSYEECEREHTDHVEERRRNAGLN